jgi:hypothetical protein
MPLYSVNDLPDGIPKDWTAFTSQDDMLTISKSLREKFGITYFAHTINFYDGRTTTR